MMPQASKHIGLDGTQCVTWVAKYGMKWLLCIGTLPELTNRDSDKDGCSDRKVKLRFVVSGLETLECVGSLFWGRHECE